MEGHSLSLSRSLLLGHHSVSEVTQNYAYMRPAGGTKCSFGNVLISN